MMAKKVTFWYEHKKERYTVVMKVFDFIESVTKHIPQKHQKLTRYYGLLSRRLELFQNLLESKKASDEQRLTYREMMQRERQKREEECAQLDFLYSLGTVA